MGKPIEFKIPVVCRLVQGSLYQGRSTDQQGKELILKSGPNAGLPYQQYFFAVAIKKGIETHWNQTEWGKKIYGTATAAFPNGQPNNPHFAWKIKNGDSIVPNKAGKRPCDSQGFPGHWILNFQGTTAPKIVNAQGDQLTEKNFVNLGDFIEVYISVKDNIPAPTPGIYLNYIWVCWRAYGPRIVVSTDPKVVGFGEQPLPDGASEVPVTTSEVKQYTDILKPPIGIKSFEVDLTKSQGASYEQLLEAGWTDELLRQHGMLK